MTFFDWSSGLGGDRFGHRPADIVRSQGIHGENISYLDGQILRILTVIAGFFS